MKQIIKRLLTVDSVWIKLLIKVFNRIPFLNCLRIKKTNEFCDGGILFRSSVRIKGCNNKIIIERGAKLRRSRIQIFGSNNIVRIGFNCNLLDTEIHIEDCTGEITIGKGTSICGRTHLACIEGKRIVIGNDCLFSSDVTIRTGDSHSILDEQGHRINPSLDVVIGNHVWVGNHTILLKGTTVSDNSIVATGAVVTKQFQQGAVVVGGNPAKILKENINWCGTRI